MAFISRVSLQILLQQLSGTHVTSNDRRRMDINVYEKFDHECYVPSGTDTQVVSLAGVTKPKMIVVISENPGSLVTMKMEADEIGCDPIGIISLSSGMEWGLGELQLTFSCGNDNSQRIRIYAFE